MAYIQLLGCLRVHGDHRFKHRDIFGFLCCCLARHSQDENKIPPISSCVHLALILIRVLDKGQQQNCIYTGTLNSQSVCENISQCLPLNQRQTSNVVHLYKIIQVSQYTNAQIHCIGSMTVLDAIHVWDSAPHS